MFPTVKKAFGILVMLFLIAPLAAILPLAFTSSALLTYPVPEWSMRWLTELVTEPVWRRSIANSLIIGGGTTVLATVLGTLAALGLRRYSSLFAGVLKTFFLLPMVVPAVVLGVGMQVFFVQMGIANSYLGVIVAHTVIAMPFVYVSVSGSLAGIDPRVELAAASLGASPSTVLLTTTLPLSLSGILSGAVMAFATSLDEVILTLFVAGPHQRTLARQMFSTIRENVSPAIAAAAFVFIVGTILVACLIMLVRTRTGGAMQKTMGPGIS
ncbi:ABC transporter permease [uncultured Cohaesibacter sp.]|uniref:ABC transporter permease n=1 Tax=uncultured Cohaesibacter sp. TaxID=1002546 RepID=UPI002A0A5F29|nr:ABC transporter permease [uncultured Cohaesibacter sp.]